MWPEQGRQHSRSGTFWQPRSIVEECTEQCVSLIKPLFTLGLWVAKRKLTLPGLTPHPSSPLLQPEEEGFVSALKLPLLFSSPETGEGFTKCVHCCGIGNYWVLWWVVEYLEERRGWGTAWSLWFTLHSPTSCVQVLRQLGTCLPEDNSPSPDINPWLQAAGHADCVLVMWCHLNCGCCLQELYHLLFSSPKGSSV